MSNPVAAAVLFAAFLHAAWNALIKRDRDVLVATVGIVLGAATFSLIFLPFFPAPDPASWPFLATSTAAQFAYYALIIRVYRRADLGLAYPIMRGTAPLFVTVANAILFGEILSPLGLAGVACISAGVLLIAGGKAKRPDLGATIAVALGVAIVIAFYTVIDGIGVRLSQSPASYTMWIFLLTGLSMGGWAMIWHRKPLLQSFRIEAWVPLVGGGCTLVSYGIALWAMTLAPVAAVAALRETSILFAVLISIFVLKEAASWYRIAAVVLLTTGAVAIRLS
jgi:drug/metabolite transporter (DMT)-like permease